MSDLTELLSVECPVCETNDGVEWHSGTETRGGIVDGRLRSHDVKPILYAGCEFCSETIKVINADEVALLMTDASRAI